EQHVLGPAAAIGLVGLGAAERSLGRGVFRLEYPGALRATARRGAPSHRLSPRDLVVGAQAWGLCALSLPRFAVSSPVFSASTRGAGAGIARAPGYAGVSADPAFGRDDRRA